MVSSGRPRWTGGHPLFRYQNNGFIAHHLLKCCLNDFRNKRVPLGRSREVDSSQGFLSQALGPSIAQETPCSLGWTHAVVMPSWLPAAELRLEAAVRWTIPDHASWRAAGSGVTSPHISSSFFHAKWPRSSKGMEIACHGEL